MEMGFDVNGCKKAAVNTKNSGIEAAMNWVIQHMGDPDFASPYVQEG
jgi:ubiquitin carboxyl-terminal hydrolase 5/13